MKKLLALGLVFLLSTGSTFALKMEVYNAIKGHTPVAVTFASEKGRGVTSRRPMIVMSGHEKSRDVVYGITLQQFSINGNLVKLGKEGIKGTHWRLEITEGQDKSGRPMIHYELYKIPEGGARKNLVKQGLLNFVSPI